MGRLRKALFSNLFITLGLLLGAMQVVVGHWVTVVMAGRPGPGLLLGLVLAAALVGANGVAIPFLRRARRRGGWGGRVARLYMAAGLGTLLLGLVILAAWGGFLPVAGLLAAFGVSGESVFQTFRLLTVPVVASLAFMIVWGFTLGQKRVEHTRVRIRVEDLHDAHRALRIVQISDLHIGNGMEGETLRRMVERVNALEPDVIALTGDLFDFDPRFIDEGARGLGGLSARLGIYAVLGNHDTYTGTDQVVEGLARHASGIRLLRDEIEAVPGVEPPLYMAGIEDPGRDWSARGVELPALDALAALRPTDGPTVLLVHRPELFPQASRLGFRVVLAGHTHGGQLALPTPGGRLNLARLVFRFHRGLYELGGATLYVNRGLGVAGPAIRFNCAREITTIELA
jgi:predicted MPP superfamily phosphohydrolase